MRETSVHIPLQLHNNIEISKARSMVIDDYGLGKINPFTKNKQIVMKEFLKQHDIDYSVMGEAQVYEAFINNVVGFWRVDSIMFKEPMECICRHMISVRCYITEVGNPDNYFIIGNDCVRLFGNIAEEFQTALKVVETGGRLEHKIPNKFLGSNFFETALNLRQAVETTKGSSYYDPFYVAKLKGGLYRVFRLSIDGVYTPINPSKKDMEGFKYTEKYSHLMFPFDGKDGDLNYKLFFKDYKWLVEHRYMEEMPNMETTSMGKYLGVCIRDIVAKDASYSKFIVDNCHGEYKVFKYWLRGGKR